MWLKLKAAFKIGNWRDKIMSDKNVCHVTRFFDDGTIKFKFIDPRPVSWIRVKSMPCLRYDLLACFSLSKERRRETINVYHSLPTQSLPVLSSAE